MDAQERALLDEVHGTSKATYALLQMLLAQFKQHSDEDSLRFEKTGEAIYTERDKLKEAVYSERDKLKVAYEKLANDLDTRVNSLENDSNQAKGAGKVIVAFFSAVCAFVGIAVTAWANGWFKIIFPK